VLSALALAVLAALPADLVAVGTIIGPRADRCVAILRSGGRSRAVAVGESAFGARVSAVRPGVVTLEVDGQRHELRVTAAEGAAPPAAALPATGSPVEEPGDAARTMVRQDVERRLGREMARILAETTLVPVMADGRTSGFTLTRVPENSLLTDAGLRPGDVITRINGVDIDSMATLVGLYARLQNESSLQAVVLRNGQPVSISVTLR
jgi:type II secretion system protein C